jgi:hypothetical protein
MWDGHVSSLSLFWKFVLIALAVAGGGLFNVFRRKNTTADS